MISVITVNYNNNEGLRRTILSVVAQKRELFEYIIIDGGSTDGSVDAIKEHVSGIDYWVSEPDKGIYDAMNKGIAQAKGDYIIFMNSGDEFANAEVLQRVMPCLASGKDFYVGSMLRSDWHKGIVVPPRSITASFMLLRSLSHQAMFIKASLLKKRPYETQYRICADWEQQVYELVICDATYERLDFVISCFDTTGVSNTQRERSEKERQDIISRHFSERVRTSLMGRNKLESRLLYSLNKDTFAQQGLRIIIVGAKFLLRGILGKG